MSSEKRQQIVKADPLFRLFGLLSMRPELASLLVMVILLIWYFATGFIVDAVLKGHNYISFRDPRELSFGLFIWVFWAPLITFYYLWQPNSVVKMLITLKNNGVFESELIDELLKELQKVLASPGISIAASVGAIFAESIHMFISVPQEAERFGEPTFWFVHWSTASLLYVINVLVMYMLIAFALRNLGIAWKIHRFFGEHKAKIRLRFFHPDLCGGVAPIGDFGIKIGLLAIAFGFFAAFLTLRPVFWGGRPLLNWGTAAMSIIYILLVPICVLPYIWAAHRAMSYFKQKRLSEISDKITGLLNETIQQASKPEDVKRYLEDIERLIELYNALNSTIPTWPIALSRAKVFGTTTLLPLLSWGLQVAFELGHTLGWL
jgi:hypothetical protein